jgi:hypothetical protein
VGQNEFFFVILGQNFFHGWQPLGFLHLFYKKNGPTGIVVISVSAYRKYMLDPIGDG